MNVSKVIVAPVLALVLVGTAACGEPAPREASVCAENEVLEVSEDGTEECEPDENGNGVDDEDEASEEEAEVEDSDKKKKSKSKPKRRRR